MRMEASEYLRFWALYGWKSSYRKAIVYAPVYAGCIFEKEILLNFRLHILINVLDLEKKFKKFISTRTWACKKKTHKDGSLLVYLGDKDNGLSLIYLRETEKNIISENLSITLLWLQDMKARLSDFMRRWELYAIKPGYGNLAINDWRILDWGVPNKL